MSNPTHHPLPFGVPASAAEPVMPSGPRSGGHARAPHTVYASDGTRLFYRDWGSGRPVLFVHSWALDHTIWNYQTLFLSRHGFRCVAFDWRGHGRSDTPSENYDVDTFADDIAAVVETLALRDVVLVGHSMGGGYIVRYLARHGSARVSKIVLIAPTIPFVLQTADNPYGAPAAYFEGLRNAWAHDFPKWIDDNKAPFFTAATSSATVSWIADLMRTAYLPAIMACHESYVPTDLRADTQRINRPTLIVQGDRDVSAPLELTGRRAAALIPGSVLEVHAGAGHGVFLTHATQVNSQILEFIRE